MKQLIIAIFGMLLLGGIIIFWDDIFDRDERVEDPPMGMKVINEYYKSRDSEIDSLLYSAFDMDKLSTIHTRILQNESDGLLDSQQSVQLLEKLVVYFAPRLKDTVEMFFTSNSDDFSCLHAMHNTMEDIKSKYHTSLLDEPLKLTKSYYRYKNLVNTFEIYKRKEFNDDVMDEFITDFKDVDVIISNYQDYKEKYQQISKNWNHFKDIEKKFNNDLKKNKYDCDSYIEYLYYLKKCEEEKIKHQNHLNTTNEVQPIK